MHTFVSRMFNGDWEIRVDKYNVKVSAPCQLTYLLLSHSDIA